MPPRSRKDSDETSHSPASSLSSAAQGVADSLGAWRARIAEAQTLSRLVLSLLKGSTSISDDRIGHLSSLLTVEARALGGLPALELTSLRHTTNARQSGVDLHGPDATAAEKHLRELVDSVCATLGRVAMDLSAHRELRDEMLERALRLLDEIGRLVELIDVTLHPRVQNPATTVAQLLDRVGETRGQTVTLEGDGHASIEQVRGLVRVLSEMISTVGESAFVHVSREKNALRLTVAPLATGYASESLSPGLVQVLRMACYLLRIVSDFRDGAWHLNLLERAEPS